MNKLFLSCVLTGLLFIVPLAAFTLPHEKTLEAERRRIAEFPMPPEKLRSRHIVKFFQEFDAFFADRFPLRPYLLNISMALYEISGESLDISKCYRGRDNWLFLGNNFGNSVDKLQGRIPLPPDALKRQDEKFKKMHDTTVKAGAELFIIIGPNKSSVYPEYLPPTIIPAKKRYITPLVDSLNKAGIKVYDPTNRLTESKSDGLLYYKTDSHWNLLGGYVAFEGFLELAGLPKLPPLTLSKEPPVHHTDDLIGMGGFRNFPQSVGDNYKIRWSVPLSLKTTDRVTINPDAASKKTVWVFGDSFTTALFPYIYATFREVRFFFRQESFEEAMNSQLPKPDMILWINVERELL